MKHNTPPADIIALNTPALSVMGKVDGQMKGEIILQEAIVGMCDFVGQKWHPDLVEECASLAYSEYYWLSMAELTQFVKRVKVGKYESNKNFNPAVLMGFLKEYAEDMLTARYAHFSELKEKPTRSIKNIWGQIKEVPEDEVIVLDVNKLPDGKFKDFALRYLDFLQKRRERLFKEIYENLSKMHIGKDPYKDDEARPETSFQKTLKEAKSGWDTSAAKNQIKKTK